MSTAYPPRLLRYVLSSKRERNAARVSTMAPDFYGDFPPSFGLYYSGPGKDFLSQQFYIAAMHAGDTGARREALYAVTFHKGPGSLQMTLYSTAEHGTTPMAIANNEKRYSSTVAITLPGAEGNPPQIERLRYRGFSLNSHTFSLNGENFELREDDRRRPRVRQLYWLNAASSQSSQISGVKSAGTQDSEDYENEIVAVWTEGSVPNRDGRLATFQFANSAITQKFGAYWTLLAVTSVLAVCQQGSSIEGKYDVLARGEEIGKRLLFGTEPGLTKLPTPGEELFQSISIVTNSSMYIRWHHKALWSLE